MESWSSTPFVMSSYLEKHGKLTNANVCCSTSLDIESVKNHGPTTRMGLRVPRVPGENLDILGGKRSDFPVRSVVRFQVGYLQKGQPDVASILIEAEQSLKPSAGHLRAI